MTAAAVAVAVAAGPIAAQSTEISGEVGFEGGAAIPEGTLDVYLEDPVVQEDAHRRVAEVRVESDGSSRTIAFSLPRLEGLDASPALRVVARLERADGWLLARGSARIDSGSPARVTLKPVMY